MSGVQRRERVLSKDLEEMGKNSCGVGGSRDRRNPLIIGFTGGLRTPVMA